MLKNEDTDSNTAASQVYRLFFVLFSARQGMNKTPGGDVYYQQRLRL